MAVGIRVGSNTSGTRSLHPWLIESNYRQVTLHLGGIYDRQSYEDTGRIEYVSRRAMPKRSVTNRVGAQSSSFGSYNSQRERSGLTGNTPYVYYKNGLGMADNGDSVAGQTVVYDAGLFQNGSYIVLSSKVNTTNGKRYWVLGVIERADLSVTSNDIIIGYVKNTFVTQIWQSDIYYPSEQGIDHPFKVIYVGESEGDIEVRIIPGTVNNQLATNSEENLTFTAADTFIYIRVECDTANDWGPCPKATGGVTLITDVDELADTDQYGYLKIAKVLADGTVQQYVQGSIWSERHKFTEPDTATYYYYRI